MYHRLLAVVLFASMLLLLTACGATKDYQYRQYDPNPNVEHQPRVVINGKRVSTDLLAVLENQYGITIGEGVYWYDAISGAWGYPGDGTQGFILPGLDFSAPLQSNASGGQTNVFINGRELPEWEVLSLAYILGTSIPQGDYWMDSYGNFGDVNGTFAINLIQYGQTSNNYDSNGSSGYATDQFQTTYFGNVGGNGDEWYYFDPDTGSSVMLP